jgi:two-component system NarL family sensor kinase
MTVPRSRLIYGLIGSLFAIALTLEYATPPEYVFGYLYIGAILLANARLSRSATFWITAIAVVLTLSNVWIPHRQLAGIPILANRLIAVFALIVTGLLGDRLKQSEAAIAQQKAKLKAQEQLAQVREDFASTLTHDLKTPLLGAIETLNAFQEERFGMTLPAQQKVLATLKRSQQTSLQLVETLLDVYRNDTEGLTLHLEPVDLATLAEEAASTLLDLATARRVHLSVSYGESDFRRSLWVNGDALQLQRVLSNLLINAINHSRRGDRVEMILQSQPSYQVVKVLDTGAGLQPEEFAHLFERFFQGQSDRPNIKGSGLGLYLSRQIIEAHGGTIWAENRLSHSRMVGKDRPELTTGAIFAFKLPAYPHPLV